MIEHLLMMLSLREMLHDAGRIRRYNMMRSRRRAVRRRTYLRWEFIPVQDRIKNRLEKFHVL